MPAMLIRMAALLHFIAKIAGCEPAMQCATAPWTLQCQRLVPDKYVSLYSPYLVTQIGTMDIGMITLVANALVAAAVTLVSDLLGHTRIRPWKLRRPCVRCSP